MQKYLPERASLRHLKNEAKALLKSQRRGDPEVCARFRTLRRFSTSSLEEVAAASLSLQDAQYAVAMEYGFQSWSKLKKHVESMRPGTAAEKENIMTTKIARTDVPLPYDQYSTGKTPSILDAFLTNLVLSAFPKGSEIVAFTKGKLYAEYPGGNDCAVVRTPKGEEHQAVIKSQSFIGGIETEAMVLPALQRLGFPVPSVLAGPAQHPDFPETSPFLVLSVLKGHFLPYLDPASRASSEELDLACRLLLEGVERLHGATEAMLADKEAGKLTRRTLSSELEGIVQRGGPWLEEPVFTDAIERLRPVLEAIDTPLVFSNFFNYTWNFVCEGDRLTGFVGFDKACFEDPHITLTIYNIWGRIDPVGWGPLNRAGLVERWLYKHNVSSKEFAPRVALRCLWRLQREHPVEGDTRGGREGILDVLRESLDAMA
jgi:hypothetical protein